MKLAEFVIESNLSPNLAKTAVTSELKNELAIRDSLLPNSAKSVVSSSYDEKPTRNRFLALTRRVNFGRLDSGRRLPVELVCAGFLSRA